MTETKPAQRNLTSELRRFDLASIFDTVPSDNDIKIVELKRRAGVSARAKLQRAARNGDLAALKKAA